MRSSIAALVPVAVCQDLFLAGVSSGDVEKLQKAYTSLQEDSCGKARANLPAVPAADSDAFLKAYRNYTGADDGSEDVVIKLASQLLSSSAVDSFLSSQDSFSTGGLDASLVECVVLSQSTPQSLAEFAAQGEEEEGLVDQMLKDPELMRDMLVAGGARDGKYGEAMAIYNQILKASNVLDDHAARKDQPTAFLATSPSPWDDRTQKTILRRCALGTALEQAVPQTHRWGWTPDAPESDKVIDPVTRYMHYEDAYLAGDLDPMFEVLTAFECRFVTNSRAYDNEISWTRTTMANYRPDHVASSDLHWRYSRAVRTEVEYTHDSIWIHGFPRYMDIPEAGGVCGARAWFGRMTRNAFGLPTWGVQQPGHAAMTTWAPEGWAVLLGASWEHSHWESRGGPDFYLETQVREYRPDFQRVLRGQWAAITLGEQPVNANWGTGGSYGEGGFWSALMLYNKKIVRDDKGPAPPRTIGKSLVDNKVQSLINRWSKHYPTPAITTDDAGTITIPAAAYSYAAHGAVELMPSFDDGQQLLHSAGDYVHPENSYLEYEVIVEEENTYFLTANFTTWHINQDLFLSTNTTAEPQNVSVFYTEGHWQETQPLEVRLVKGRNVLQFSRWTNRGLAFKEIFLFKTRPDIPKPDPSVTPAPAPAPVPLDNIIQLPVGKTCESQGILELSEEDCALACEYLNYKYTGARSRAWFPGCFALGPTSQWAGNCNFNSNTSGTGMDDENAALAICQRS